MAGSGPGDLHTQALDLLAYSSLALDAIPISDPGLLGAPLRAFVSPGEPALDCCDDGQLTVHVSTITEAATKVGLNAGIKHRAGKMHINLVTFVVTIARCFNWPEGGVPKETTLEALSEQSDADAWALWNGLWNSTISGDLFSLCGQVYFDGMRAITQSGGCVGWTLTIRAEVEGYV